MFAYSGSVIHVTFSPEEIGLVASLADVLESVGARTNDPAYEVLHRPVYEHDGAANSELSELVEQEVDNQRVADRAVLQAIGHGQVSLTEDEARGFLRSLNESRLVLAARSRAFDDDVMWEDHISEDPALAAVAWLGFVQGELITELRRY